MSDAKFPYDTSLNINAELYKPEKFTLMVHNPEAQYTLSFHKEGKQIGKLDFKGDALKFTGDAEESAKVFIDWIAQGFHKRLEQERTAERDRCIDIIENYQIPVGASTAGEIACEMTYMALREIRDEIKGVKDDD